MSLEVEKYCHVAPQATRTEAAHRRRGAVSRLADVAVRWDWPKYSSIFPILPHLAVPMLEGYTRGRV